MTHTEANNKVFEVLDKFISRKATATEEDYKEWLNLSRSTSDNFGDCKTAFKNIWSFRFWWFCKYKVEEMDWHMYVSLSNDLFKYYLNPLPLVNARGCSCKIETINIINHDTKRNFLLPRLYCIDRWWLVCFNICRRHHYRCWLINATGCTVR